MSNKLFKRLYLRAKVYIENENSKRIAHEKPLKGILVTKYNYVEDGDPLHKLNLYKRQDYINTKALPLIIDVHGGGWICGDKDTNNNFCSHMASEGNVVASLSYRTIDRCTLADQIRDIFDFFRWLEEHSEEYELNLREVFITGDSAGAQLALLAYCVNQNPELQALFSVVPVNFCVKGLILNHGVCYLDEAAYLPKREKLSRRFLIPGLLEMLYGENYSESPLYLYTVVPSGYISRETVLPPILLITSRGDTFFSYQTFKLYNELKTLGKNCDLYCEESEYANHVFNVAYPDSETGKKCNRIISRFINGISGKF